MDKDTEDSETPRDANRRVSTTRVVRRRSARQKERRMLGIIPDDGSYEDDEEKIIVRDDESSSSIDNSSNVFAFSVAESTTPEKKNGSSNAGKTLRRRQPSKDDRQPLNSIHSTTATSSTAERKLRGTKNVLKRFEEWTQRTTERIRKIREGFTRKLICLFIVFAKIFCWCCMRSIRKELDEMNEIYNEEEEVVRDMEEADAEDEEEERHWAKRHSDKGKRKKRKDSPKRSKRRSRNSRDSDSEEDEDTRNDSRSDSDEEYDHRAKKLSKSKRPNKTTSRRILDEFERKIKKKDRREKDGDAKGSKKGQMGFCVRLCNSRFLSLTIWITAIIGLIGLAAVLTNNSRSFMNFDSVSGFIVSLLLIIAIGGVVSISALVIYALIMLIKKPINWCKNGCFSLFGLFSSKVLE